MAAVAETVQLLDPKGMELFIDKHRRLSLYRKDCDDVVSNVRVTLMFPLTDRDAFVRVLDADEEEIGIIRQISSLDTASQAVVHAELDKAYFIPVITAIRSIQTRFSADVWTVETQRGERTFEVVGKSRNIRFLKTGRVIVRDIDGNRYEIDLGGLDRASRRLLEQEL